MWFGLENPKKEEELVQMFLSTEQLTYQTTLQSSPIFHSTNLHNDHSDCPYCRSGHCNYCTYCVNFYCMLAKNYHRPYLKLLSTV